MEKITFEEIQEEISMLAEYAMDENTMSDGDINKAKKLDKEIAILQELRNAMPEWTQFLNEVQEDRRTEEF